MKLSRAVERRPQRPENGLIVIYNKLKVCHLAGGAYSLQWNPLKIGFSNRCEQSSAAQQKHKEPYIS